MQPWMRKIDFTHFFPQGLIPQLETLTTPVVLTTSEDKDKRLNIYDVKVLLFN